MIGDGTQRSWRRDISQGKVWNHIPGIWQQFGIQLAERTSARQELREDSRKIARHGPGLLVALLLPALLLIPLLLPPLLLIPLRLPAWLLTPLLLAALLLASARRGCYGLRWRSWRHENADRLSGLQLTIGDVRVGGQNAVDADAELGGNTLGGIALLHRV